MHLKAYLAVAALCIIWGTSYMFMKIGLHSFSPFHFAGMRQFFAGVLLLVLIFAFQRKAIPSRNYIKKQAIYGLLMIGAGNGLVNWSIQFVPTGIVALIGSMIPIIVVVVNYLMGVGDKVNKKVAAGVLLGFLGPVIIFGSELQNLLNPAYLLGMLAALVAGFFWASGSIYSKDYNRDYPSMMNAGFQMVFGGGALLIVSFFVEDPTFEKADWMSLSALLYLITVSSALAFSLYLYALDKLPAAVVSLYAYVNPLVAIFLGWLVLDEALTLGIFLAFIATAAGIYLVNLGFRRPRIS